LYLSSCTGLGSGCQMTTVLGLNLDWSGVGALITAIIAAIAILVALRELSAARDAAANEIYREFLTQSMQFPEFICPDKKFVNPEKQLFNGNDVQFWKYEVYVDLMLTAFEELFELTPHDPQLMKYIGGYLYSHERYLTSKYFTSHFVDEMDPKFWSFATDALSKEKASWE
jgi:hypothetical protein